MAELATIARPYAEALFAAVKSDLDGASRWVDELAAIAANPQLQQFAGNPRATEAQVFDLIAGVAKTPLSDAAKNFLRTVIGNGRLSALPEIAAQFRAQERAGRYVGCHGPQRFPDRGRRARGRQGRAGKAFRPQAQRQGGTGPRVDRWRARGGG